MLRYPPLLRSLLRLANRFFLLFLTLTTASVCLAEPARVRSLTRDTPWLAPIVGSFVDCPFSATNCDGVEKHDGVDMMTQKASGVVAPADGFVIVAAETDPFFPGLSNIIVIDHGDNTTTLFAGLGIQLVKTGERVHRGQRIGMTAIPNADTRVSRTHVELHHHGKAIDPFKRMPYVFYDLQLPAPSWPNENAPE